MSVQVRRLSATAGVAAVLGLAAAAPAAAGPVPAPPPIGPNQFFAGAVNGMTADVRIPVICDPDGRTGHPRAGQTVAVLPVSVAEGSTTGFTGEAGKVVGVGVGTSTEPQPSVTLRRYQVAEEIPTSVLLPCDGPGVVSFLPEPASTTSRPATVRVLFVPVPR
jgi:hypothetical protein